MDIEDKDAISPEEQAEDNAALAEAKEEEVRVKVLSDLGIEDNDDNQELVDKLVKREMDHRSKLSKAIGQKIKLREGKSPAKSSSNKGANLDPVEAARQAAREEFEQRDLDEMDHSEKVKDEIKKLAKLQNISVRKAEKDSYIQHLVNEELKQKSIDAAAKNGPNRSKSGVTVDVSKPLDPTQFDLSTEEGRKEWEEAKAAKRAAASQ